MKEIGVSKFGHYDHLQGKGTTIGTYISIKPAVLGKAKFHVIEYLSDVKSYWMKHMSFLRQQNPSKMTLS